VRLDEDRSPSSSQNPGFHGDILHRDRSNELRRDSVRLEIIAPRFAPREALGGMYEQRGWRAPVLVLARPRPRGRRVRAEGRDRPGVLD
jgi:hypothetical protein